MGQLQKIRGTYIVSLISEISCGKNNRRVAMCFKCWYTPASATLRSMSSYSLATCERRKSLKLEGVIANLEQ